MCSGTPFGQVPVLAVDGKEMTTSCSINRYLAKQFGMTPLSFFYFPSLRVAMRCLCSPKTKKSLFLRLRRQESLRGGSRGRVGRPVDGLL